MANLHGFGAPANAQGNPQGRGGNGRSDERMRDDDNNNNPFGGFMPS